jgi:site-specific recombinase XerD
MALEQVFECPRTLQKLRSGPLGKLLDGFCEWLLQRGFRRGTIRAHLSNVALLNEHLGRQRAAVCSNLCAQDVDGFLQAYPSRCRHRGALEPHLRRVRYSVRRFVAYLDEQGRFDPWPQREFYAPLLDAYLGWMEQVQHASVGTLALRAHYLTRFLRWLGPEASREGLDRLTADRVERFFVAYAQTVGRAARRSMQATLRTFFRFCLHQDYLRQPLDCAVPTLRTYQLASVPRGLTDTQAQHVLQSLHRDTDVGRRDYAILQLLYTYGVRGSQVRALRLEQVDWAQNQILFPACKQGKHTVLPLLPEVGQSLLDYVRHSRPPSTYPQVFLTARAPFHPIPSSSSLSAIVARRIQAAGIEIPRPGAHAFRHGFATRMLHQGHSLKAIADVLGHRHLGSTFVYTKVDLDALRQVALEWPEEGSG